ncbi:MAG: hypothetical protein EXQ92_03675 [Alphaproteobacteria bacterium]|nr:hypothetical protein [Alphaproteobacteria bacterium]
MVGDPKGLDAAKLPATGTPNKLLTPETYDHRIAAFLRARPKDAKVLTTGSIEMIDLAALAGPSGGLTPEARMAARMVALAVIERMIGLQDLIVPFGDDAFVILFNRPGLVDANALSERIAGEISRLLHAESKTRSLMAQGFAAEIEETLNQTTIGTPKDLIAAFQRAGDTYRLKQRQRLQAEDSGASIAFYPVLNIRRRAIAAYEARLLEAREGGTPVDLSYDLSSPALSAEIDTRMVQCLARSWEAGSNDRARPFVLLPVRLSTLSGPLYRKNLVEALDWLPIWAQSRIIFHLCTAAGQRPPLQTPMITETLQPYSKLIALRLPPDAAGLDAVAQLSLTWITPQPHAGVIAAKIKPDQLKAFAKAAAKTGQRTLYSGADSVDDATRARDCGFAYVSGPGVSRAFPKPGPRYRLGRQLAG